jgi:hypothetical protein
MATPSGEIIEFDDLNFRVRTPPKPWVRIDIEQINDEATAGFMRRRPELLFMIFGERVGLENGLPNEGLAAISQANLR